MMAVKIPRAATEAITADEDAASVTAISSVVLSGQDR